jgi:hypothetical protein
MVRCGAHIIIMTRLSLLVGPPYDQGLGKVSY